MGVKWPIFLGFFLKKFNFLYSVQNYVLVQIKGSFLHKYRSIFLFWGYGGKMAYFFIKNLNFSLFICLGLKYSAKIENLHKPIYTTPKLTRKKTKSSI